MEKTLSKVKSTNPTLREEIENLHSRIARRAFELFTERGGALGLDLDDWFRAERELVNVPQVEVAETDKNLDVRVALPGFNAEDVEVFVEPWSITIKGERKEETHKEEKTVKYSELRSDQVFREFQLPSEANPEGVSAVLEDGILSLTIPKVSVSAKKVEVKALTASTPQSPGRAAGDGTVEDNRQVKAGYVGRPAFLRTWLS